MLNDSSALSIDSFKFIPLSAAKGPPHRQGPGSDSTAANVRVLDRWEAEGAARDHDMAFSYPESHAGASSHTLSLFVRRSAICKNKGR